jgi:hypothetical protein
MVHGGGWRRRLTQRERQHADDGLEPDEDERPEDGHILEAVGGWLVGGEHVGGGPNARIESPEKRYRHGGRVGGVIEIR